VSGDKQTAGVEEECKRFRQDGVVTGNAKLREHIAQYLRSLKGARDALGESYREAIEKYRKQDAPEKVKALVAELVRLAPDARLVSLESAAQRGQYVYHVEGPAYLKRPNTDHERLNAAFEVVPGLADPIHVSFRSLNYPNHYLAHGDFHVRLQKYEDSDTYRRNATFKAVKGLVTKGAVSFEAITHSRHYIHARGDQLFLDGDDGSLAFSKQATFLMVEPQFKLWPNFVYLSDLSETEAVAGERGHFFKRGNISKLAGNQNVNQIKARGRLSPNGIFLHPPVGGSYARVSYKLDKRYRAFQTAVAIADNPHQGSDVPVTFIVVGDEKVLWTSKPLQRCGTTQDCTVNVVGVDRLELRTVCSSPRNEWAWAAWIEPRLLRGDEPRAHVGAKAPVSKVPDIKSPWDDCDITEATPMGGWLRLEPGKSIAVRKGYAGAIAISAIARTRGNGVGFRTSDGGEVIFNWDATQRNPNVRRSTDSRGGLGSIVVNTPGRLATDAWYVFSWRITERGTEVLLNGRVVFTEARGNDLGVKRTVRIFAGDAVADAKSFAVTPLR
jgi:hypothetical protein